MNTRTLYQTQADSLIGQLRQEQNEYCRKLQSEASAWSRQHLRDARRKARILMTEAIAAEREALRREIAAAEASIAAQQRHRHQLYIARILATVMARIPEALMQRWKDRSSRLAWLHAALGEAERRLGVCDWRIRYAPGLEPGDIDTIVTGAHADWLEDPSLDAGLVIQKHGARLDASVAGLLADPVELHGRVLALLQPACATEATRE